MEEVNNYQERQNAKMNELRNEWIWNIDSNWIRTIEEDYKAGTTELIQDAIEIDFHEPKWPISIDKGNRGILFIIIYNILKNAYKMINQFPDYSMTLEALHRDIREEWINDSEKEELKKKITKLEEK